MSEVSPLEESRADDSVRTRHSVELFFVLTIAVVFRLWIATRPDLGHESDLTLFTRWMKGVADLGLADFYASESFCDYPPLMLLALKSLGEILQLGFANATAHHYHVAVKLFACLADLAIGGLLVVQCQRLFSTRVAVLGAAIFLLSPVPIYHSAYWGQLDSVYTALLLATLVLLGRERWFWVGCFALLSVAAKFQSVAVLPIVVFEIARTANFKAVGRAALGVVCAAVAVATPFLVTGTLSEVLRRAYVDVVGQYQVMSQNAYNLWTLLHDPAMPDTEVPSILVRIAAGSSDSVAADSSWLLALDWRTLSLGLFALVVAVVVSLYSRRPGTIQQYGAAGLLALSFFLFPTEMHERYAFPATALLVPWALSSPLRERAYWMLSLVLLLNLAAVLPPDPLAPQIGAAVLLLFVVMLARTDRTGPLGQTSPTQSSRGQIASTQNASIQGQNSRSEGPDASSPSQSSPSQPPQDPVADAVIPGRADGESASEHREAKWISLMRRATLVLVIAVALGLIVTQVTHSWIVSADERHRARAMESGDVPAQVRLGDLEPIEVEQGWGELRVDRSVSGTPLRIKDHYYTHGLGTHAPARLVYAIPADAVRFETLVGIDKQAETRGSVGVRFELDGELAEETSVLRSGDDPVAISIAVEGARQLTIEIDPTDDTSRFDHVDLALAHFTAR